MTDPTTDRCPTCDRPRATNANAHPSVDPGSAIDDSNELLDAIERSHPDYDRFMADALADALTGKRETVKPGQIGEWISKIAEAGKIVESNHGEE